MNIKITFYDEAKRKRPKILKNVDSFYTVLSLVNDNIVILKNNRIRYYHKVKDIIIVNDNEDFK